MVRPLPEPLLRLLYEALPETPPGRTVWVALSGGLDSSLLLTLAAHVCHERSYPLHAIHVNHGLQVAASDFEAHCRRLCQRLNVPLVVSNVTVERCGEGIESAARRARYRAFEQQLAPGDTLWLAQHQDDQAETFLLAALRGSGVRGLAAMPYRRDGQGITLLRPWLSVRRHTLADAANEIALEWCEDPTNDELAFDRNRLRHQVMTRLNARWPGSARALAKSAQHAGEADQLLAEYAANELAEMITGSGCLDARALHQRSRPRQRLLVRTFCQQLGLPTPPQKRLESLLAQLGAPADAQVKVAWQGVEARVWRQTLYLMAALAPLPEWEAQWDGAPGLPTPLGTLHLSMPGARALTLRWRQGGEVINLPGRGRRDVKRLLQESGLPPWERQRLLIVWCGARCLGVIQPPRQVLWQAEGVTFTSPQAP